MVLVPKWTQCLLEHCFIVCDQPLFDFDWLHFFLKSDLVSYQLFCILYSKMWYYYLLSYFLRLKNLHIPHVPNLYSFNIQSNSFHRQFLQNKFGGNTNNKITFYIFPCISSKDGQYRKQFHGTDLGDNAYCYIFRVLYFKDHYSQCPSSSFIYWIIWEFIKLIHNMIFQKIINYKSYGFSNCFVWPFLIFDDPCCSGCGLWGVWNLFR